jgi:uncharacterized protein YjbJ (UPF0337 family)
LECSAPDRAGQETEPGAFDEVAGRVLEAFSKLTGKRSTAAKGKAAPARGAGRSTKGSAKKRARR